MDCMLDASLYIGLIGLTIFVGYLASIIFEKTKIPDILILILMGALIGPILHIVDGSLIIGFAPLVGMIALIIIVFEGGTKLNFFEVMDELPESIWFTLVVSSFTAIAVMAVLILGLGENLIKSALVGVVVAGTSYEIIVPLLSKITIDEKSKTLLNLESALNDIVTIVGILVLLNFFIPNATGQINPIQIFISSFSISIFLGILAGAIWVKAISAYKGKQFEYLLTLAAVFFMFAFVEGMNGNGITAVLTFGLILGNSDAIGKILKIKDQLGLDPAIGKFNSEVSFFVKTMLFVYMGIVINLQNLGLTEILVGFFMFVAALGARIGAVEILVRANPALKKSEFILSAMLPRGLATAVLATIYASQIKVDNLLEIVLLFMLFTNIFATAATYYYETRIVPLLTQNTAPTAQKK